MVDVWEDMFGIDIEDGPQLGLVDISDVGFLPNLCLCLINTSFFFASAFLFQTRICVQLCSLFNKEHNYDP